VPVDIVGINQTGALSSTAMFAGKPLSWIRDSAAGGIQSGLQAEYRDVVILNPLNGEEDRYNLTLFPIDGAANAANRQIMKNKLIAAATPVDSDNDKLPDFWEMQRFGDLSRTGASVEALGLAALLHFAHCSGRTGEPEGLPRIAGSTGGAYSMTFIRRRGLLSGLVLSPEFSEDLIGWSTVAPDWQLVQTRTLYDGSGGELQEWRAPATTSRRFARVHAALQ